MHDPVEPRAHEHDDVGILERVAARRAHRERMGSGITPLPIGEARNGSWVRSMKARTSSSARE